MHEPVGDLCLHNIVPGCAHEQKAHGVMGSVDRCSQQNEVFAMLVGLVKRFNEA